MTERIAYLRRMADASKLADQRNMDRWWRFGPALSHARVDRSEAVQRLIAHDAWQAARFARAVELGRADEFEVAG